jgi:hypothetical protein
MSRYIDLTGNIVGEYLTVIGRASDKIDLSGRRRVMWRCVCKCGQSRLIDAGNLQKSLKNKTIMSCGCYNNKRIGLMAKGNKNSVKNALSKLKGYSGFRAALRNHRSCALNRKIQDFLTDEECKLLFLQECFYCDRSWSQIYQKGSTDEVREHTKFLCNGIDRWENDIGYRFKNCRPCCMDCNREKGIMSGREFLKKIENQYFNLVLPYKILRNQMKVNFDLITDQEFLMKNSELWAWEIIKEL